MRNRAIEPAGLLLADGQRVPADLVVIAAGIRPLRTVAGEPMPDPQLRDDTALPEYVRHYRRPGTVSGPMA